MNDMLINDPQIWCKDIPQKPITAHKYDHGTLLVYASQYRPGAAILAVMAARRMGVGMVVIAAPQGYGHIFQAAQWGAVVDEYMDTASFASMIDDPKISAVLIGPGSGINVSVRQKIIAARLSGKSVVLDADGISTFAGSLHLLVDAPDQQANSLIITPHEGEFARLFPEISLENRHNAAITAAQRIKGIIVLKGHQTIIANADGASIINTQDSPYLATAGSGDVLAGMIGALVAQGMDQFKASAMAVYMHGMAGKILGRGLICEDIIAMIPQMFKNLEQ